MLGGDAEALEHQDVEVRVRLEERLAHRVGRDHRVVECVEVLVHPHAAEDDRHDDVDLQRQRRGHQADLQPAPLRPRQELAQVRHRLDQRVLDLPVADVAQRLVIPRVVALHHRRQLAERQVVFPAEPRDVVGRRVADDVREVLGDEPEVRVAEGPCRSMSRPCPS